MIATNTKTHTATEPSAKLHCKSTHMNAAFLIKASDKPAKTATSYPEQLGILD